MLNDTECPCCHRPQTAPSFESIVAATKLSPLAVAALEAVWEGGGLSVPSEKIIDRMWMDDPDGGPADAKMYRMYKATLNELRTKLSGTGVGIVTAGYRQGHRLVMGGAE
jgi:hypothetical protein